jgi:copper chaperone CopZ
MKTLLRSQELTCPSCVAKIERALKALPGVEDVSVQFNSGRIVVEHDPAQAPAAQLAAAVKKAGYAAQVAAF